MKQRILILLTAFVLSNIFFCKVVAQEKEAYSNLRAAFEKLESINSQDANKLKIQRHFDTSIMLNNPTS